jgi:hypothetical protein
VADELTLPQPPAPPAESPVEETAESPVESPAESPAEETAVPAAARWARWRHPLTVVGWVLLAAVLVAAAVAAVGLVIGRGSEPSLRASPGDCFSGESDSDLKRVACDDPGVKWTVVGVVENKSKQESTQNACAAWPSAEASYWESRNGTSGFVLCLGAVRAA